MSHNPPLVSIVTPVYNGASFLEECIESSLSQTYPRWEHVIVDNCSTDSTAEIASRFAAADDRFRVYRNERTVSALENHNIAVRLASEGSNYCKILHADDRLLPHCLEKMVAVAEAYPSIGIVGSYAYWQSEVVCLGLPEDRSFFEGKDIGRRTLLRETYPFWSPSCLLHRIEAVRERPRFYNETDLHADVQCSYEILSRWDFGFIHEPLTVIGSHVGSRTSTLANPLKKYLATNLDLLATYGRSFLTDGEFKVQLERQITDYYRALAEGAFELRGPAFWNLHRQALESAGHPMSIPRLLRAIVSQFTSSPIRSGRRVARSLVRR